MRSYLSIKEMEKLKRLGIDISKASMVHVRNGTTVKCVPRDLLPILNDFKEEDIVINSFSLADMFLLLPAHIIGNNGRVYGLIIQSGYSYGYSVYYESECPLIYDNNILMATYKMLCWLAKNGYLENKEKQH